MHRAAHAFLITMLLGLGALASAAATPDPLEGTWTLDLAKSTFKPGPASMQSQTRVFTRVPDGIHMTVDVVLVDGSKVNASGTYRPDGRDYAFTGVTGIDQIAMTQTSDLVQSGVNKLNGNVILHVTLAASPDHRTLTLHVTSVEGSARPTDNTLVFNRN